MYHLLLAGKAVSHVSKLLSRSGSTWPGHMALKADPKFVRKAILKNPGVKVILIAGTNGKTTTTKALTHILESQNIKVLTNNAGANLLNGLASLIVKHISMDGTLKHKALLFEVDENSLPLVLQEIPNPHAIILLNLFRDQLDRYGEVNSTAEKWKKSLAMLSNQTLIVANADDPQIAFTASRAKKTLYYTIDNKFKVEKELSHAVDSTTCPKCNKSLEYSEISYSHLGNYKCSSCDFKNPKAKSFVVKTDLLGTYNLYNLSSTILVADKIFNINPYTSIEALKNFKPAFGRQEIINVDGRKVMVLLSKNPTGFNESLKVVLQNNKNSSRRHRDYSSNKVRSLENKGSPPTGQSNNNTNTLLLLLNDRVPDGRDISWIWDVDFDVLKDSNLKVFVSGDRAYDMANRLLFSNISHEMFENYDKAYKMALEQTPNEKTLTILATYSAMLDIRKLISGKSIL